MIQSLPNTSGRLEESDVEPSHQVQDNQRKSINQSEVIARLDGYRTEQDREKKEIKGESGRRSRW